MADSALKDEIEARSYILSIIAWTTKSFHNFTVQSDFVQAGTTLKDGGRVEGSTAAQTRHIFSTILELRADIFSFL